MSSVFYIDLKPQEFLDRLNECPVAYLPLGTLEWHGLHMPIGADGIQSSGVFEKIAAEVGGIVLPMLFLGPDLRIDNEDGTFYNGMDYYGFEKEHSHRLCGSAYYVDKELFKQIIDTTACNLARAGFKILVAHGHGPSIHAFREMKEELKEKYGLDTYVLFELGLDSADTLEAIQCDHAARNETSITMALRPDLVDISRLDPDEIPVAVWGEDPRTGASEEYGNHVIDVNVALSAARLKEEVAKLDFPKQVMEFDHVANMLSGQKDTAEN